MSGGPRIVSFVGASGAGKTTVIEQLVPRLQAAGLRVGTVKHASHGHDVDKEGSDSWRHRRAGAEAVLLAGASGTVLFLGPVADAPPAARHHADGGDDGGDDGAVRRIGELVGRHMGDLDVVLAEGYAPVHDVLVEVRRSDVPPKVTSQAGEAWLTISDRPAGADAFGFDQLDAVAQRIVLLVTR